jgi:glyoxylase-like metal-dependent hydrolase (beta-lactamase superfamily II)
VGPYIRQGKFVPFDKPPEILPSINAISASGHPPEHSFYSVESKRQKLVLWGDVLHFAAVQFPEPQVTVIWDSDDRAAASQRKRAFAEAARDGYLVAGAHLPFPGIGRLRGSKRTCDFVLVVYQMPR